MTRLHLPQLNWTKNLRRLPAGKGRLTALALPLAALLAVFALVASDIVEAAPSAPQNVSLARNTQHNQLVVNWEPPATGADSISQWQIECSPDSGFPASVEGKQLFSPGATGNLAPGRSSYAYTCEDLTPKTRYYARVRAVNGGIGPWSATSGHLATNSVASIATSAAITEGDNAVFTVTLSPPPDAATEVTVNIRSVSGDFGISGGTNENHPVTVGTGGTGTLTLATTDDSTKEKQGSITARVHPALRWTRNFGQVAK